MFHCECLVQILHLTPDSFCQFNMKYFILLIITLLFQTSVTAQTVEGTIKDAQTGEPLSYVNIGVIGKNIGTVSSDAGKFRITIPSTNSNDTVRISFLGYSPILVTVAEFVKQAADKDIRMRQAMYDLPGVVVSNRELKEKILGNTTESKSNTIGFSSNELGNEIGILIKIKRSPTFIKSFSASIVSNDNKPVKLRLNFYSVKNGLPDQLIQNRNIIVSAPVSSGKLDIDLKNYNIVVEDDFFVTLEWIENASGRIRFSASLLKGAIVGRETSQAEWIKTGLVGIGFTVKAAY